MAIAVYGTTPLPALLTRGMIGVQGDIAAAQDFVDLFALEAQS